MIERDLYKAVGGRIRQCREDTGLTQEALAKAIGLTRTSITNVEKGRQSILLHKLVEIAAVLHVQPHKLLPNGAESNGLGWDKVVLDKPADEQRFVRAVLDSPKDRKVIRHDFDTTKDTRKSRNAAPRSGNSAGTR